MGQSLLEKMSQCGATQVIAPRSSEYDLREVDAVKAILKDTQPDVVIHLAAVVGGIGANRAHPAEFFYENLVMGVHLMHEAWQNGIEKFVTVGTVCAYPKFVAVPFKEETIWDGTFAGAIDLYEKSIARFSEASRERATHRPDWLVVTVDYHS